jgi:hypothetical protein
MAFDHRYSQRCKGEALHSILYSVAYCAAVPPQASIHSSAIESPLLRVALFHLLQTSWERLLFAANLLVDADVVRSSYIV